jgi:hypothetical protein
MAVIAGALIAAAPPPRPARAASDAVPVPRIVWNEGERFYVAAPDSGALAAGMVVRVLDREREIARGEVTRVIDGVMASVRLTGGAIGANARLDRLEIRVEPAPARAVRVLRLGLPAASRDGPAFACPDARLDLDALPRAYRAETLAVDAIRLLAADSAGVTTAWPETLLVRSFGDRADEEIALERGELDVAVFWPGEPSARLREPASGYVTLLGDRARGVLAALDVPPDSAFARRLAPDMAALNADMFGGDLRPWAGPEGAGVEPTGDAPALRFVVDAALPGRRPIDRFLTRRGNGRARADDHAVRLAYLDAPLVSRDSLESAWHRQGVLPLFTLRCPEVCDANVAGVLRALGADAFANLLRCGAGGRRP